MGLESERVCTFFTWEYWTRVGSVRFRRLIQFLEERHSSLQVTGSKDADKSRIPDLLGLFSLLREELQL